VEATEAVAAPISALLNLAMMGQAAMAHQTVQVDSKARAMEIGETLFVDGRQAWRAWLAQHHHNRKEIWLVYYKKSSGKVGISYEESVEEALCFGWIDGAIKGIDEHTYAGRFTPRRPRSPWSASNRERVARLLREGRMTEAGMAVLPADLS